jgi:hypothetical protein
MRVYVLALALATAACSRWSGSQVLDAVETSTTADPATVSRIVTEQLQSHGYQVTTITPGVMVTLPRPVTEALHEAGDTSVVVGRQWIMQVTATEPQFTRGTRLRVAAFIVPPGRTTAPGDSVVMTQRGIPVTSANRPLFAEVRTASGWITAALGRR